MSDYNKIISTINSVSSSYSYSPDPANLICIDSSNNRIGINTLNPTESIDISGGNVRAKDYIFMEPINNSISLKELLNSKASINNPSFTGIISASNIDVSGNIIPLRDTSSNLGSSLKRWSNAYIRDISASNIDVSGNIIPLLDASSNLGSSLKRWRNIFVNDLSVNTINGLPYINLLSISGNTIPSITNTFNLGSTTNYWNNAYIRNVITSARAYQEISGDISWNTVNGYYGLAKDAYPSLNPLSSGDLAVRTWTARAVPEANSWSSVCWSPQLRLFVTVSIDGTNRVMISFNGINWIARPAAQANQWRSVCWSPELKRFVAVSIDGNNRVMYSSNGLDWTSAPVITNSTFDWVSVCWSPELGLFVAIALNSNRVMYSSNGIDWVVIIAKNSADWRSVCWSPQLGLFVGISNGDPIISNNGLIWRQITELTPTPLWTNGTYWKSVCWSPQLGLFVAVADGGTYRAMTSSNGINWTYILNVPEATWWNVTWSPELELFIAVANSGNIMTSPDGINWTSRTALAGIWYSSCWSRELGIFVAVGYGTNKVMTSSLKGRPPTSYNMFDSSFNRIDENGKWDFSNVNVTNILTLNSANVTSDGRLKHNEVVIANGLTIIDKLNPKFYQKTFIMLDASYNGDLSGYSWNYEAGLIAQEVLQINDISYVVSGGDYYEETINYYDTSTNYYEVSNNLITQAYGVNYNSVFVYGLAAIKELHAKVKTQETTILSLQTAMLEQKTLIDNIILAQALNIS
jgi:hypothetical protein